MTIEAASMADSKGIDSAWRGAEAYHFWLLAHRQLYAGEVELAMCTALNLRNYEDILDPKEIYSFLALASFYNKFFGQCSKAFIKLESLPSIPANLRDQYADLAMSIFLKNAPGDPRNIRETGGKVKSTGNPMMDAMLDDLGGTKETLCVASGRSIKERDVTVRCKTCKHVMISGEIMQRMTCPLCHAMLPPPGDKARPMPRSNDPYYGAGNGGGGGGYGGGGSGDHPWGYAPIGEDDAY